jgi:hypothetical protein
MPRRVRYRITYDSMLLIAGHCPNPAQLTNLSSPPNELISVFPLVLVPVYLVPLSVLLHLASLAKLHGRLAHKSNIAIASA